MRTIKFRGKRVDNGEWVYGYLISHNMIGDIEQPEYNNESLGCGLEDSSISDRYESAEYGYQQAVEDMLQNVHEVHPETVGQFTGLVDSEGTEVYEGDKIQFPYIDPKGGMHYEIDGNICVVEFKNGCFGFQFSTFFETIQEDLKTKDGEYISNAGHETIYGEFIGRVMHSIHDNKELLEGAE